MVLYFLHYNQFLGVTGKKVIYDVKKLIRPIGGQIIIIFIREAINKKGPITFLCMVQYW